MCVCLCVCVIACEQNSSPTNALIWTRFSLYGCNTALARTLLKFVTLGQRSRSEWRYINSFFIIILYFVSQLPYGCDENGHRWGDADFVLQADQVSHLLFCTCVYVCICDFSSYCGASRITYLEITWKGRMSERDRVRKGKREWERH